MSTRLRSLVEHGDRVFWGTGIRGLMRGMATLLQGKLQLLAVKDKVGRPPGELGVNKSKKNTINQHNRKLSSAWALWR